MTVSADDFDTDLIVRPLSGRELSNDDFGSTRVSQVRFNAAQAGTVTIQATAYNSFGRGDYEVRASSVRATVVSTVEGRLDYQDAQQFTVELIPLGFSGYLRVTAPDGQITRSESTATVPARSPSASGRSRARGACGPST